MHRCCKSLNEVNILAEQKNTQPPITNPALVEAMNEMKKERSQKSEVAFVNTLKTARFFVPANISKVQQAAANDDGTVELKEQPQIRFLLFNNQEGKKYFPLFTDIDEYRKWDKHTEAQMAAITFRDLCQILQKNPNPDAAGAVVNPFGQNIMIPTETLFRVNNTEALAPGTKIQLGSLKEEPTELLDAMRYVQSSPSLSQAQRIKALSQEGTLTPEKMKKLSICAASTNPIVTALLATTTAGPTKWKAGRWPIRESAFI